MSRILRCFCAAVAVTTLAVLTGCSSVAPSSSKLIGTGGLDRVFRLGPGDRLKVTVFGEEDLSGESEVDGAGNATLPLIGPIPVKGKTLDEFTASVTARLKQGYLNDPKVGVQVVNYRPIYVHGEVRRGGEFPYKLGLKVADAVALAGGYSYRADQSYVELRREGESAPRAIALDGELAVLPGDNIVIPERFF